jgi:cysteine-rich repeat protein
VTYSTGTKQWTWTCSGMNGSSTNASCSMTRLYCGDAATNGTEVCDDGNTNDLDGCQNDCTLHVCGDGVKANSEACDDGNTSNNDTCSSICQIQYPRCIATLDC